MQQQDDHKTKTTNNGLKCKREKFRVEFRKHANELLLNQKRDLQYVFNSTKQEIILESASILEESQKIEYFASELSHAIQIQNKENIMKNITCIRSLTCRNKNPPLEAIINTDIVPHLIKLLGNRLKEFVEIHLEILWLLTNLSSGELKITKYLIDNDILHHLKEILVNQEEMKIVDQAIMCCANIASEEQYRNSFFLYDFDAVLFEILTTRKEEQSKKCYKNIAFFLSSLSRKNIEYRERLIPFLDTLAQFLFVEDEETMIESAWSFYNIAEMNPNILIKILGMGVMTKIIKSLLSPNDKMKWASLRLVSLIAGGPDCFTDILYQNNIYIYLSGLLDNARMVFRREVLYCVSNLVAEDKDENLQIFIDSDIFQKILKITNFDEFSVIKEAIYVLTNFVVSSNPVLVRKFVYKGGLKVLVHLLNRFIDQKEGFLMNILGAIEKILATEGKDEIEFIREFVNDGGVQALKEGASQFNEIFSERSQQIYDKYIRTNFI